MAVLIDLYFRALGNLVPGTPLARSKLGHRLLQDFPSRHFVKPSLGLYELDDLLGWRLQRGVTARHSAYEFRVVYHTDESGCRATPSSATDARLAVLGCSWTFGHGVDDDQTFASLLSAAGFPCRNGGVPAYGPAHALLLLRRRGWLDWAADAGAVLLYCWCPDQLLRAWRRDSWIRINSWVNPGGRTHPVFDLEHGELVHGGLIGLEGAAVEATDSLRLIERMEWRVTIELCKAMRSAAAARDIPFFIVLPPVRDEDESAIVARMSAELAIAGVPHFDLDRKYDDGRRRGRDMFFTSDSHPTPAWHRQVADGLAAKLAKHHSERGRDSKCQ